MNKTEFRWLVIRGAPVSGAIRMGGPADNLWQVLQYREFVGMREGHFGDYREWGEWQDMPVTFAPTP